MLASEVPRKPTNAASRLRTEQAVRMVRTTLDQVLGDGPLFRAERTPDGTVKRTGVAAQVGDGAEWVRGCRQAGRSRGVAADLEGGTSEWTRAATLPVAPLRRDRLP